MLTCSREELRRKRTDATANVTTDGTAARNPSRRPSSNTGGDHMIQRSKMCRCSHAELRRAQPEVHVLPGKAKQSTSCSRRDTLLAPGVADDTGIEIGRSRQRPRTTMEERVRVRLQTSRNRCPYRNYLSSCWYRHSQPVVPVVLILFKIARRQALARQKADRHSVRTSVK